MSPSQEQLAKAAESTQQPAASLLDQVIQVGRFKAPDRAKDLVGTFVEEILKGTTILGKDVEATVNARIAEIDRLLSRQLDEILHDAAFKKLEASWRGLRYLLDQSETGQMLKIKVLNVKKAELLKDYRKAAEFDQNSLFQKVYEEGYGTYGGAPYGALVGDYEFNTKNGEDMELLEGIAGTAASAHCPFLSAASVASLGAIEEFTQLNSIRDISAAMASTEFTKWNSFRKSDDSRYVGLTMPHMLMRVPYGPDGRRVEEFDYEEQVDGSDHGKYLWGNAAYALASKLTGAFAKYEFCTAIRGPEGGGKVEGLPVHNFRTWEGDIALKCPVEVQITDRREKELADQGFIPLVHCKDTDYAAFFSVQSCQKPVVYNTDAATKNARLSAQLPYLFAVCRFAHYAKVMVRDKIGRYMSRGDMQTFLSTWLNEYVLAQDDGSPEAKAKRPLRSAEIDVIEDPSKPGAYRTVMHLQPHLQLDELNVSLRLVADIPKKG
jgi:type VI secretion system protein ImpC